MAPGLLNLPPELLFEIIGYLNEYSRVLRPARCLLALNDTCTALRVLVRDLILPGTPKFACPHKFGEPCPWNYSLDPDFSDFPDLLDTLVFADLDLDHFAVPNSIICEPCSAAAALIVTYLSNRRNPFPSLLSLRISLPFGPLSQESHVHDVKKILELLLRTPRLRHLAIYDWLGHGPISLPQIPAHIAVEVISDRLSDKRLNCILKSVGQLRAITSDNFGGCNDMEDRWTKDLQYLTIKDGALVSECTSGLMPIASIKCFADAGLYLTPYISTLVSNCYEIHVDFVDRQLKIMLQSRDVHDYSNVISIFPALFPPAKVLCVALGYYTDEDCTPMYIQGDCGINEREMGALANSLASLPDLQHIDVELNDPEKYSEHRLESWLTCAALLAKASNSVRSIKLRASLKKGALRSTLLIAQFDVRRREDVEVIFRGFQGKT